MPYFGCPYCGGENVHGFVRVLVCTDCHMQSSTQNRPIILPGQIVSRPMKRVPNLLHQGILLDHWTVFHSTPDLHAHFGNLAEFAEGMPVRIEGPPAQSAEKLRRMWETARMLEGRLWSPSENCEDITFHVRDGQSRSPTRSFFVGGSVVLGLALVLFSNNR